MAIVRGGGCSRLAVKGVAWQYGARLDRGMQSLSVRVLGEFDVDGVEPSALGSRKGRALLRLLALARGQAVSADALASALWGDALPSKPADQVAVLVSRLRTVVGQGASRAHRRRVPAALRLARRRRAG